MKNFIKTTLLLACVIVMSSCGGGGSSSSSGSGGSSGGGSGGSGGGGSDLENIENVNAVARDRAITAEQKLGSVTQGSLVNPEGVTQDSVRLVKDVDDNLMFSTRVTVGEGIEASIGDDGLEIPGSAKVVTLTSTIVQFGVENTVAGWTDVAEDSDINSFSIWNATTFAQKFAEEYVPGDFYIISGFWYRDDNNFGVFADGTPRTEPLPTTGTATYEGGIAAIFWSEDPLGTSVDSRFENVEFGFLGGGIHMTASFDNADMQMNGRIDFSRIFFDGGVVIDGVPDITEIRDRDRPGMSPYFSLNLESITDDNGDGGFTGGNINCEGCRNPTDSSWGGQFFINPVTTVGGRDPGATSGDWPAGFAGTLGADGVPFSGTNIDLLGDFVTFHSGLCDAVNDDSFQICQ